MIRPWLTLFSGLLVSVSATAVAWSQTSQQPTLAERMSALRRGWSQDSSASLQKNQDQQKKQTAPSTTAVSEPKMTESIPQVDGRSLIPGSLFKSTDAEPSPESGTSTARVGTAGATPRMATRLQAGATPPPQSTFTLPGLGGSPLPADLESTSDVQDDLPSGQDVSREMARDYPVTQSEPLDKSSPRPRSSPATGSGDANSHARHSPHIRGPMHIDPQELRRELSGSFTPEPTAKDADSNSGIESAESTKSNESQAGADSKDANSSETEPRGADLPLTLPAPNDSNPSSAAISETSPPETQSPQQAEKPTTTEPADAASAFGSSLDLQPGLGNEPQNGPSPSRQAPFPRQSTPLSTPSRSQQQASFGDAAQAASKDPGVLASNQAPIITTDIRGPKQIIVGREATYRVQLRNQGEIAAERIVASIQIPSWAEIIDTTTSQGAVQQSQKSGQTDGVLEWQIARLEGRASETLDIRLVPKSSRPLELGVNWTVSPVGSRAVVEVQEPKLQMNMSGPDDVLFGKPQLFRLTLTNPGTGLAEGVTIKLIPPGAGDDAAMSHELGDLAPGTSRSVEVELTAREAGKLNVKASASAEGGLACDTAKEVFCRKPELEVDWRGPEMKYAGTDATYFFRVRNPGTAPAEDVAVVVSLPEGAELKTASEGQAYDAKRREVAWRVGSLGPGDDSYMELKCILKTSGTKQLRVMATNGTGELSSTKQAETNVIALADLKLEVSDPVGPVAVGDEAVYEIRVQNRGANSAKDVNIIALFSEGIEPGQVEGALFNVADGRVSFKTIEELPAGRQIVLRVRAHGLKAGTHVFRAEVLCRDLETKLAAEETTLYYADDAVQGSSDAAAPQSVGRSENDAAAVR